MKPDQLTIWEQVDHLWRLVIQGNAAGIEAFLHPRDSAWSNTEQRPLCAADVERIDESVNRELGEAVIFAEKSTRERLEDLTKDVITV
jgi:hypothetical protein